LTKQKHQSWEHFDCLVTTQSFRKSKQTTEKDCCEYQARDSKAHDSLNLCGLLEKTENEEASQNSVEVLISGEWRGEAKLEKSPEELESFHVETNKENPKLNTT
jgi:hypothetical protein